MTATDRATIAAVCVALVLAIFSASAWMIGRVDARIDRLDTRIDRLDERVDELAADVAYIRGRLEETPTN